MWKIASPTDDRAIVEMCLALYQEDPSPNRVIEAQILSTLTIFREQPVRGRALVLEVENQICGYSFLSSFWSNECGGEICVIDEIFVRPQFRGKNWGRNLISQIHQNKDLWPNPLVAIDLEVTPKNIRAREFYLSLGFAPLKNSHMRRMFS
jgi:ribosomal protein S18 acetylase RimI-like enzyme